MDKKERAKIIAVKLEEVLERVTTEKQANAEKLVEELIKTTGFKNITNEKDNLDMKRDALEKQLDAIRATIYATPELKGMNLHISTNKNYDDKKTNISISFNHNCCGNPAIVSSDVMTHLTRYRNTEDKVLAKVVKEAFALLLEDDAERMAKFLEL